MEVIKRFEGSMLILRSRVINHYSLQMKGKVFLAKLECSSFNDTRASGKSAQQTFPGMQLSGEGREVEQRDVRCAKAIMAESHLYYVSRVSFGL